MFAVEVVVGGGIVLERIILWSGQTLLIKCSVSVYYSHREINYNNTLQCCQDLIAGGYTLL